MSRASDKFKIRVEKDYMSFCAGHFIIYKGTQCERLHGHNYRIGFEITAGLDGDFLVFDFIELKEIVREVARQLDHRMLVPLESRVLEIETTGEAVRLAYQDKEWVFPLGDCALLPIENTTAELLARWIGEQAIAEIERRAAKRGSVAAQGALFDRVRVEVEESPGQSAFCDFFGAADERGG